MADIREQLVVELYSEIRSRMARKNPFSKVSRVEGHYLRAERVGTLLRQVHRLPIRAGT